MTPQQAKKFLKDNDVKFILAQFVDIHGAAKAKAVPVEHLDMVLDRRCRLRRLRVVGIRHGAARSRLHGRGRSRHAAARPVDAGLRAHGDLGHVHGKPYPYCSRVALKNALDALAKKGLTLYTGIEPEFMLLKRRADGSIGPCDDTDTLDKPCYDYKGLARSAAFLERLVDALRQRGRRRLSDRPRGRQRPVRGQLHLRRRADHGRPPRLLKMAASEIASQMGMIATFMPKPFSNRTGTGAHFHMSIGDAQDQEPVPRRQGQERSGLVEDGLPLPRRPAGARARR